MKKVLGFIGLLVVLVGLVAGGAKLATRQSHSPMAAVADSLNPLVTRGTVYVKTTTPTRLDDHGAPIYVQTAVDANGNTRPIEFMGMKKFVVGKYLAIKNKGAYVETYAAVAAQAVPQKAFSALQN